LDTVRSSVALHREPVRTTRIKARLTQKPVTPQIQPKRENDLPFKVFQQTANYFATRFDHTATALRRCSLNGGRMSCGLPPRSCRAAATSHVDKGTGEFVSVRNAKPVDSPRKWSRTVTDALPTPLMSPCWRPSPLLTRRLPARDWHRRLHGKRRWCAVEPLH
jgi:hypothetical protein